MFYFFLVLSILCCVDLRRFVIKEALEPQALFGLGICELPELPAICLPAIVLLCTDVLPQLLFEVNECIYELIFALTCFGEGFLIMLFFWVK